MRAPALGSSRARNARTAFNAQAFAGAVAARDTPPAPRRTREKRRAEGSRLKGGPSADARGVAPASHPIVNLGSLPYAFRGYIKASA